MSLKVGDVVRLKDETPHTSGPDFMEAWHRMRRVGLYKITSVASRGKYRYMVSHIDFSLSGDEIELADEGDDE